MRIFKLLLMMLLFPVICHAQTVVWGTPTNYDEGANSYAEIEEIDTDKYVICYADDETGKCEVHTVSGTTPTQGSSSTLTDGDIVFQNNFRSRIGLSKLNTNKFSVGYVDDTDDDGNVEAGSVSGTAISLSGSPDEFTNSDDENISCAGVNTDAIICIYNDEGGGNTAEISACTFSGTNGSCGTSETFASLGEIRATSTAKVATDKAVYAYEDQTSGDGFVGAATRSGTNPAAGTEIEFSDNDDTALHGICTPVESDDDRFLIVAKNNADTSVDVWVGTLSGTTVTVGDEQTITENSPSGWVDCIFVSSDVAAVVYANGDGSDYPNIIFARVDWTARTAVNTATTVIDTKDIAQTDPPYQASSKNISIALISGYGTSPKIAVVYADDAGDTSDPGYVIIGDVTLPADFTPKVMVF